MLFFLTVAESTRAFVIHTYVLWEKNATFFSSFLVEYLKENNS